MQQSGGVAPEGTTANTEDIAGRSRALMLESEQVKARLAQLGQGKMQNTGSHG